MNTIELVNAIKNLILDNDKVKQVLGSSIIKLSEKDQSSMLPILSDVLAVNDNNAGHINGLVETLASVFADGKLEIVEIPILVKAIYETVIKMNLKKILSSEMLALLIKVVVIIVLNIGVVKVNDAQEELIVKSVDTALDLLTIKFKLPKKSIFGKLF